MPATIKVDMDRHDNSIIEVKDIAVASYLYATNQVQLLGKRRLSNGAILFQFTPKSKAEELIQLYWNLNATAIQPKVLYSAFRDIKDMIFSG